MSNVSKLKASAVKVGADTNSIISGSDVVGIYVNESKGMTAAKTVKLWDILVEGVNPRSKEHRSLYSDTIRIQNIGGRKLKFELISGGAVTKTTEMKFDRRGNYLSLRTGNEFEIELCKNILLLGSARRTNVALTIGEDKNLYLLYGCVLDTWVIGWGVRNSTGDEFRFQRVEL